MSNDILRYLTVTLLTILALLSDVCGQPVDDVVRAETLKDIRKYMNESAEPCDNFYEFACGNWPVYHPRKSLINIMTKNFEENVSSLMTIDNSSLDTEMELKVKYMYQSCIKIDEIKEIYVKNLGNLTTEFGKIPAVEGGNWQEGSFDWLKTVAEIKYKYNIGIIVNSGISPDLYNSSANAMYIANVDYIEHISRYSDEQYVANEITFITGMTSAIWGISEEVAKQTAKDILAFEIALAQGMSDLTLGLQQKDIYLPTSVCKLQISYSPVLNIMQYLSTGYGSMPSYTTWYEDRKYLKNVMNVISMTPKKIVANYIHYTLMKQFLVLKGNCIAEVYKHFPSVFENILYRKYATNRTQSDLEVLWKDIKLAFEDVLNSPKLDWMQPDTRKQAIEKLNAMEMEVPASKVNEEFARFMDEYTVDKEDFIKNMKTLRILNARRERDNLYNPPARTIDAQFQKAISPTYFIPYNKIQIPVTFLQPHYEFSSSLPSAYNFGRLGFAMGHELIHGFDDRGRNYDAVGTIREWWDKESSDAFNDRVKCFIDQYEQYEFGGQNLTRRLGQSENIADNSGIRVAYQAYLKWYEDSARTHQERKLETFPYFHYNNKQLFFISFAQAWCADRDPKQMRAIAASDEHTPSELRAVAVLSNMIEFSDEFNCPLGSTMNPITKCEIY